MKRIIQSALWLAGFASLIAWGNDDCPSPTPAGKCGLAKQDPSCANGCVSITASQTGIQNCEGTGSARQCLYNQIHWSAAFNYYQLNYDPKIGKCIGCSTQVIVHDPDDLLHPATTHGTCYDAYSGGKCE